MAETFKKGQMVPKRLKMALTHRKVQHRITFGCDVVVEGRVITPVRQDDGAVFMLPHRVARRRNNGTWQRSAISFNDVFIAGYVVCYELTWVKCD
ncbi:hypothetical protein ACI00F_003821 [Cronobacter dublinensis]